MQDYKKIIVPLALDNTDKDTIAWASSIAKSTDATEVLFVHPYEDDAVPEPLQSGLSTDQELLEEMHGLIADHAVTPTSDIYRYKVAGAKSSFIALMEAADEQQSDLIVIGKSSFETSMPVRVARHSACSVMSIPEGCSPILKKLMVTTDFSDHAREALELGVQVANTNELTEIDSVHVYSLGRGSRKVTLPESTQREMASDFAEKKHLEYLEGSKLNGLEVHTHNYYNRYVYTAIEAAAILLQSDLIIISCKGKNALKSWLLGSVTENLLTHSEKPVLAARTPQPKRNFLGFLKD
ncbi:MAG: universal stress protein [Akkermansiaceae bacterium]